MTDLFKEKAQNWDRRELVRQLSAAVGRAMRERLPLSDDMTIMDFGAGTGLITGQLADRVRQVVAVDTFPAMLEKLQAKPELHGRVTARCQDILAQPLDQQFDCIVSAMAMHHVQDTERLIRVLVDHLKPGGHLALADLDTEDGHFHPEGAQGVYHHGFDRDALAALMERQGLADIQFITAHKVERENGVYPVFLATAIKP